MYSEPSEHLATGLGKIINRETVTFERLVWRRGALIDSEVDPAQPSFPKGVEHALILHEFS